MALAASLAACNDDPVGPEEPEVEVMRLLIGANDTVLVENGGIVTSGPIILDEAAGAAITAQWLKADGSPETLVNDSEFELRVEPANVTIVEFVRASAFSGTLIGVTAGSTTIEFILWHLEEDHDEFGRNYHVPVIVN